MLLVRTGSCCCFTHLFLLAIRPGLKKGKEGAFTAKSWGVETAQYVASDCCMHFVSTIQSSGPAETVEWLISKQAKPCFVMLAACLFARHALCANDTVVLSGDDDDDDANAMGWLPMRVSMLHAAVTHCQFVIPYCLLYIASCTYQP